MDALSALRLEKQPPLPILDLLRSFGIADANALYALAARLPASPDTDDPTRAARATLGQWFGALLDRPDLSEEAAFVLGRAAFVALAGGSRWPKALMADEVPEDLRRELRQSVPIPSPPNTPTMMLIQSLDRPAPLAAFASWLSGRPTPVHPG